VSKRFSFYIFIILGTNPPNIVILCRNRTPGKNTIWTQILKSLKELNINPHDLVFIQQDGCNYLSMKQFNEIAFCY